MERHPMISPDFDFLNGQGQNTNIGGNINPSFDDLIDPLDNPNIWKGHIEKLREQRTSTDEKKGLFLVKPMNKWLDEAKSTPTPEMLFSEFWHESELCILFADTNMGKTTLTVQIADSISRGIPIKGFKMEAQRQKVLFFDFELSAKQLEVKYSVKKDKVLEDHYNFDENFIRVQIDPEHDIPDEGTIEAHINSSIERCIIETGAKIVIIDNITYLRNETEKAKDALPLMKHLKALKTKYGLSILALAHTPKRDLSKPITRNDVSGSKALINFVDSCFAIGESHQDKNLRYIKQIKERNTEKIYDSENVVLCQMHKQHNYLALEFIGFAKEQDHLKQVTEKDREALIEKVKELSRQGNTQRQISTELGISVGAVNKYLKK
jgi:predicted transcriptional regulator